MAFDGITIHAMVHELRESILDGRISKIAQPENDALCITVRGKKGNQKLFISASASLPLIYFTNETKTNPMVAPNFCMLLRKYIASGRIVDIYQPAFERIIIFELEHLNELGDLSKKKLIVEIMGKHSNIIFTDEKDMIIDSIKHIPSSVSSVREVLPGRDYFIPNTQNKKNPLDTNFDEFQSLLRGCPNSICKAIYSFYEGFSPCAATEIAYRAHLDADMSTASLGELEFTHLYHTFELFMEELTNNQYAPNIVYDHNKPMEYCCFAYEHFKDYEIKNFDSISEVLESFYASKEAYTRNRQKSAELRTIVTTALERNRKKYDLQLKQLKDADSKEKFKIYGELLYTYGNMAKPGDKKLTCINYYNNEEITIPLDETKTAMENATHYFDKYNKLKRTKEALEELTVTTKAEIDHLESVLISLDYAKHEEDLNQIKEELSLEGIIKKKSNQKKQSGKSKPFHYRSSDGFDLYVGKNNLQNDELTFKFANRGDWWFHAKGMPGSHVILKAEGKEIPDRAFEEAAKLAAYYSKGNGSDKMDIDYVQRKEVKKPNGSKPGFVVYYTNYSLTTDSDISTLTLISD